jgi:hypothetical protein
MYPNKNKELAKTLMPTINFIGEQLLPKFVDLRGDNSVSNMHDLMFLLALKAQGVFTSHVIHTIIDQNWDLKGFKIVMLRILKQMNVEKTERFSAVIDEKIRLQNH